MEFMLRLKAKGMLASILMLLLLSTSAVAQKKRMVGLGGWLVVEQFITPELFDGFASSSTDADLCRQIPEKVKEHHATFVTEADFQYLAEHKIQAVRIPVGWWIAETPPPAPYVDGYLQALDNAFDWGSKHGIQIIVDLHAAPGAQNLDSHSGSVNRICKWSSTENIARSLSVIKFLAERYASKEALLGIELLNEPWYQCTNETQLKEYYSQGYNIVRSYSDSAYVIFSTIIGNDPFKVNLISPGQRNVVIDIHLYNVFKEADCDRTSAKETLGCIYGRGQRVKTLSENFNIFIGEWSNVWHAEDGTLKELSDAQLKAYGEASFGWSYWTLKTTVEAPLETQRGYWSFKKNVAEGLI